MSEEYPLGISIRKFICYCANNIEQQKAIEL